jgi:2-succinyl-5-enolpyruvyl-6-hydroxy-3-cyclohexene-1-carboxylate synthase
VTTSQTLSYFLAPFINQLYQSGVRDIVISPGSRSTPLTVLFREHPELKVWMNVDERSAGFFALGMAKANNRPVALVCSSGTAAANYYPAIIEAKYSEVPLIVLTADRPHELREVGAPQAIDQVKLFGTHVKQAFDLPLPETGQTIQRFMKQQAARAVMTAEKAPKGPVHLNFPFREPLMPDVDLPDLLGNSIDSPVAGTLAKGHLDLVALEEIAKKLNGLKRPLIIVGPSGSNEWGPALHEWAEHFKAPIIADPLSQMRAGAHSKKWVMDGYDAFLRVPAFLDHYKPDGVIRFGPLPVSKPLLKYIESGRLTVHLVVNEGNRWSDPTHQVTDWVDAEPLSFITAITELQKETKQETEASWGEGWIRANTLTRELTSQFIANTDWFEGHAIIDLLDSIPNKASIFAGNSMPIRDLDSFFHNTDQQLMTFGNRGTNGIDGINSTALGIASKRENAYLVIGDLSFFHDTNGLMVGKQYNIDLTVVVVNNNGGGIFSFLPQAQTAEHFEELFGTPLDLDVADVAKLFKASYLRVSDREGYTQALKQMAGHSGLKIIEYIVSRPENVAIHKRYWEHVSEGLSAELKARTS